MNKLVSGEGLVDEAQAEVQRKTGRVTRQSWLRSLGVWTGGVVLGFGVGLLASHGHVEKDKAEAIGGGALAVAAIAAVCGENRRYDDAISDYALTRGTAPSVPVWVGSELNKEVPSEEADGCFAGTGSAPLGLRMRAGLSAVTAPLTAYVGGTLLVQEQPISVVVGGVVMAVAAAALVGAVGDVERVHQAQLFRVGEVDAAAALRNELGVSGVAALDAAA